MIGLGSDKKHKMCCFANPLMRWDEYRYFYNTGKFIFAMMNEQTFNQTGTGGLLLPKALTFSLKSPQRHVLRKIQLRIWDFFSLLPLWQLLCSKCFIICVFPMKKSKVALEAQKNNPCHDFHILYGSAELFGYRTWSSDLLGLMPHFAYALRQFSCFFRWLYLTSPNIPTLRLSPFSHPNNCLASSGHWQLWFVALCQSPLIWKCGVQWKWRDIKESFKTFLTNTLP